VALRFSAGSKVYTDLGKAIGRRCGQVLSKIVSRCQVKYADHPKLPGRYYCREARAHTRFPSAGVLSKKRSLLLA
jgi:hypothetical protein